MRPLNRLLIFYLLIKIVGLASLILLSDLEVKFWDSYHSLLFLLSIYTRLHIECEVYVPDNLTLHLHAEDLDRKLQNSHSFLCFFA